MLLGSAFQPLLCCFLWLFLHLVLVLGLTPHGSGWANTQTRCSSLTEPLTAPAKGAQQPGDTPVTGQRGQEVTVPLESQCLP